MNVSSAAQWALIGQDDRDRDIADEYDIMMIQEPYVDYRGNPKVNRAWCLVKPTAIWEREGVRMRTMIMVNKRMAKNTWREWRMEGAGGDVVGIQVETEEGLLTLVNIYNDGANNEAV
ncbi:hypothetical protein FA15DRAFT_577534, partial [Coprinopsis marcescibilis]